MIARLALLAALLAASSGALAQTKLFVVSPATLDPDAPIVAEVKAECKLPEIVGDNTALYVQKHLRRAGVAVKISDLNEAADGAVVKVTILAAYGQGATAYAGAKSITVRADLIQGGKVVESRILRKYAKTGDFSSGGWLSGSCSIFERASRSVANLVGRWAVATVQAAASGVARVPPERLVAIESPASVEKDAPFPEEVKQECALPMILATHVFDRVSLRLAGSRMVRPGEVAEGRLLRLTILEVDTVAEGKSSTKSVVARADVLDAGKVIATKEFGRGGSGGIYATTCMRFEGAAIWIGQQVAEWLPGATGALARSQPLETVKEEPGEAEPPIK